MSKVFLIEEPRSDIDLSTARDFGEIHVLFPPNEHRASVFNCAEFGEEALSRLRHLDYDAEKDMLCVAGSMIAVIVTVAAIFTEYSSIDVLFFNARISHYIRRTLGHGADDSDL